MRECIFNMDDYVRNSWTYHTFEPISGLANKVLKIEIEFSYDPNSSCMGVFEDASRRTFVFKLMNKLGKPILGKNVLFVDFRA